MAKWIKTIIFLEILLVFAGIAYAAPRASNIDSIRKWAWNDVVGWIDHYATNNTENAVKIEDLKIIGSAVITRSGGTDYVSFDCATAPTGNICTSNDGPVDYWVSNNPLSGNLAGWAWSDSIGWISFCGNLAGDSELGNPTHGSILVAGAWVCPATVRYQVTMGPQDPEEGTRILKGYAWNDVVGWINFNCDQSSASPTPGPNTCADVSYYVKTYWGSVGAPAEGTLISKTFDTCESGQPSCLGGVNYNFILWKGVLGDLLDPGKSTNTVKFQLATSNCSNGYGGSVTDPQCNDANDYWGTNAGNDGNFLGPNGAGTEYGPVAPGNSVEVNFSQHINKRYFRYKIFIRKTQHSNSSPVVEDVVVNWSH